MRTLTTIATHDHVYSLRFADDLRRPIGAIYRQRRTSSTSLAAWVIDSGGNRDALAAGNTQNIVRWLANHGYELTPAALFYVQQLDDDDAPARAPGRPTVGPPVHIRLPQQLLDWVDDHASQQHLSRAQAIRALLDVECAKSASSLGPGVASLPRRTAPDDMSRARHEDVERGQAQVEMGIADWSAVQFAVGAFASGEHKSSRMPAGRARWLLDRIRAQLPA